jgi:hypothetical protein
MKLLGQKIMKFASISAVLLTQVFLSGCYVPAPVTQTSEIRGVVVDKANKRPLSGVLAYYKKYPRNASRTDSNGRFALRENKEWELVSIGAKMVPDTSGLLVLEDERYQRGEIEIRGKGGWPIETKFELTRKK